MTRSKSIDIRTTLTTLLPGDELQRIARNTGFVQRRRKLDPVAMFWTLALGFGAGTQRSFSSLRRLYGRMSGAPLAQASFHARFDASLTRFLRAVLCVLVERLAAAGGGRSGQALLARFEDVVAADASVVKVHRLLAKRFAGTRTNSSPAAAKLHLAMSVSGHGATRVKITGERVKDHKALTIGPWVRGKLLLFDLGYFRYQMFDCIDRNRGCFVSRLPLSANPRIVAVHRRHRGRAVALEGCKLDEVADRLKREELDVEIEVEFQRRVYAGKRRRARRRLRLIGLRDPNDGLYWFYVTNIGVEELPVSDVAQLYACRWQIELVFRELKSRYELEALPSAKADAVEALILSSVIGLLASRRLLEAVRRQLSEDRRRVREERWSALLATLGTSVLEVVLLPTRVAVALGERLEAILLHEAPDPNVKRLSLLERVDQGKQWAR